MQFITNINKVQQNPKTTQNSISYNNSNKTKQNTIKMQK